MRDDPFLCHLDIHLPNINAKSISSFLSKEKKKSNLRATTQPKVTPHQRVLSEQPMEDGPKQQRQLEDDLKIVNMHISSLNGERFLVNWLQSIKRYTYEQQNELL